MVCGLVYFLEADMAELADALHSKCSALAGVRVRLPVSAHRLENHLVECSTRWFFVSVVGTDNTRGYSVQRNAPLLFCKEIGHRANEKARAVEGEGRLNHTQGHVTGHCMTADEPADKGRAKDLRGGTETVS